MTQGNPQSVASIPSIASAIRRAHGANRSCCMYGVQCYRRNPVHFNEYRHPALELELGIGNVQSDDESDGESESSASDMSDEDGNQSDRDDPMSVTAPPLPAATPYRSAVFINPVNLTTPTIVASAHTLSSISSSIQPIQTTSSTPASSISPPTPVIQTQAPVVPKPIAPSAPLTPAQTLHALRPAWLPQVHDGSSASRDCSKFGGQPYLLPNEASGVICRCTRRMSFLFQLRSDSLPDSIKTHYLPAAMRAPSRAPLFQLWLCKTCLIGGTFGDGSTTSCMRWIDSSSQPSLTVSLLQGLDAPAEKQLVGWNEKSDYPLSIEATQLLNLSSDLLDEMKSDPNAYIPISSAKLGGFPNWLSGISYGQCQQCNATNELFFQLADYDQLDLAASSNRRSIFILICPKHRNNFKLLLQRK